MASFLKSLDLLTELDLSNNFKEDSTDAYDDHHFRSVLKVICNFNRSLKILRLVNLYAHTCYLEWLRDWEFLCHFERWMCFKFTVLFFNCMFCRFNGCKLYGAWDTVASLFKTLNYLTELDLSNNDLGNGPYNESDDYLFKDIYNSSLQILRFVKLCEQAIIKVIVPSLYCIRLSSQARLKL